MERMLASSGGFVFGIAAAVGYSLLALVVITLDRFRANSTSKDDPQVELKILLFALALMGVFLSSDGAAGVVASITSGFKGGGEPIKLALPAIAVGAGTYAAVSLLFLPRTNSSTVHAAEALALLIVGVYFGSSAIAGAYLFITNLVMSGPWETGSGGLAKLIVDGAIGVLGLTRLGALAGWVVPVRPVAPPPPQYPPQGGGYPPQGGGYPPQGGGYPPQGSGYPPQGGGYPPQGGGYPPQGGGYPPQGGGYPPR